MEKTIWTPADLLQMSGAYWSACALHTGVELDLFTPLAERPHTVPELAARLSCADRGLAMLLGALAALGLLEKQGEAFAATAFSADYLSRTSPGYLGYIIRHHHHLMAGWARLDESVRRGGPIGERISHGNDAEARESFEMGMFNLAMQLAPRIVPQIDLSGRRRLLDLGGGPGTYAIHFCQHNPDLTAVVYDLPSTRPFAEKTIASFGLADRIVFSDGDFIAQGIEGRYDVAWLSHILHSEDGAGCAIILEKAVAALEPGGLILIQEFILDDAKVGPLFPALFSLNMLLGTPAGQSYSQGELMQMLCTAGASDVRRLPIELPNGAGIIMGRVP
ncbi:methyltransferase [Geobacter argillaceus]|uniref:Methyltransferase family protein n=1 Tax=Geobacter argillaceus TaxID=345631 RepID=A0A562VNR9_9BACT|nr:methyltransferase [Geobacter argillaceus]TWJ19528.1 methyltransferase family protein [Geobacter argillaceus]